MALMPKAPLVLALLCLFAASVEAQCKATNGTFQYLSLGPVTFGAYENQSGEFYYEGTGTAHICGFRLTYISGCVSNCNGNQGKRNNNNQPVVMGTDCSRWGAVCNTPENVLNVFIADPKLNLIAPDVRADPYIEYTPFEEFKNAKGGWFTNEPNSKLNRMSQQVVFSVEMDLQANQPYYIYYNEDLWKGEIRTDYVRDNWGNTTALVEVIVAEWLVPPALMPPTVPVPVTPPPVVPVTPPVPTVPVVPAPPPPAVVPAPPPAVVPVSPVVVPPVVPPPPPPPAAFPWAALLPIAAVPAAAVIVKRKKKVAPPPPVVKPPPPPEPIVEKVIIKKDRPILKKAVKKWAAVDTSKYIWSREGGTARPMPVKWGEMGATEFGTHLDAVGDKQVFIEKKITDKSTGRVLTEDEAKAITDKKDSDYEEVQEVVHYQPPPGYGLTTVTTTSEVVNIKPAPAYTNATNELLPASYTPPTYPAASSSSSTAPLISSCALSLGPSDAPSPMAAAPLAAPVRQQARPKPKPATGLCSCCFG